MKRNLFDETLDVMNPAPRCPVVLMLDVSGSMRGKPLEELNAGFQQFLQETRSDEAASMSVDLEVITFGTEAKVELPFTPLANVPPMAPFEWSGRTGLGSAIRQATADLKARREQYRQKGLSSYRPWIIVMTDGGPNDTWKESARELCEAAQRGKFMYFGIEIGTKPNHAKMCQIVPPEPGPVRLKGLRFRPFFRWLTDSLKAVSASTVAEQESIRFGSINSWADLIGA